MWEIEMAEWKDECNIVTEQRRECDGVGEHCKEFARHVIVGGIRQTFVLQ